MEDKRFKLCEICKARENGKDAYFKGFCFRHQCFTEDNENCEVVEERIKLKK